MLMIWGTVIKQTTSPQSCKSERIDWRVTTVSTFSIFCRCSGKFLRSKRIIDSLDTLKENQRPSAIGHHFAGFLGVGPPGGVV